jgi:hypothetical protein
VVLRLCAKRGAAFSYPRNFRYIYGTIVARCILSWRCAYRRNARFSAGPGKIKLIAPNIDDVVRNALLGLREAAEAQAFGAAELDRGPRDNDSYSSEAGWGSAD